YSLGLDGPVPAVISGARLGTYFNIGDPRAVLPAVDFLLHQNIQPVGGVQGSSVFVNVVLKLFEEPDHCNAAFMFYWFTHSLIGDLETTPLMQHSFPIPDLIVPNP